MISYNSVLTIFSLIQTKRSYYNFSLVSKTFNSIVINKIPVNKEWIIHLCKIESKEMLEFINNRDDETEVFLLGCCIDSSFDFFEYIYNSNFKFDINRNGDNVSKFLLLCIQKESYDKFRYVYDRNLDMLTDNSKREIFNKLPTNYLIENKILLKYWDIDFLLRYDINLTSEILKYSKLSRINKEFVYISCIKRNLLLTKQITLGRVIDIFCRKETFSCLILTGITAVKNCDMEMLDFLYTFNSNVFCDSKYYAKLCLDCPSIEPLKFFIGNRILCSDDFLDLEIKDEEKLKYYYEKIYSSSFYVREITYTGN